MRAAAPRPSVIALYDKVMRFADFIFALPAATEAGAALHFAAELFPWRGGIVAAHRSLKVVCAAVALLAVSSQAAAYTVDVYALANSSNAGSGTGASTGLTLGIGDWFSVTVPTDDLWNAGPLPRWSNANGLTGDLYATGSDDSGEGALTLIGQDFGLHDNNGLSAPYGALVGQIGAGAYFLIGTSYLGQADAAGELKLFYWDSEGSDNTQWITATVNAVPLPAAGWLLLSGLGAFAGLGYRRRRA